MNGKFSNGKKVLAALLSVCMLVLAMPLGIFAADIAPEAVVLERPAVATVDANQIGKNYVHVSVTTEGATTDTPVVAYLVDKEAKLIDEETWNLLDAKGSVITLGYYHIIGNATKIKLGVPDDVETGKYSVLVALHGATELTKTDFYYVGVEDVDGFFEAVNMKDVEVSVIKEMLDKHYDALSVIAFSKDEKGEVLKMTGEDYTNLTDDTEDVKGAKTAFAELLLNGVNGKYSDGKGYYEAENSEAFIKEAYITAAYNAGGIEDSALANLMYRFDSVIGFDGDDENLYAKIENKDNLAKVVKTMAETVNNADELKAVLEQAAAVQIVNETYLYNLVNIVEKNNDIFDVSKSQLATLKSDKNMRSDFCEYFKGTYYSVEEVKTAWVSAYNKAKKDKPSTGSGPVNDKNKDKDNDKVTTNFVSTQISSAENQKDINVKIADHYTDMSGTYAWASDAVLSLTNAKIVSGYGDKTFRPGNSVTRGEFMKMVVNVFGLADITATCSFADVDANSWQYIYVASAEKCGVAQGYGNGLFGVNDPVTRQDAVTIIYRAAQIKGVSLDKFSASTLSLTDSSEIASYATDAVGKLYYAGVYLDASNPASINKFEPTRNASRAYLAVILNQIYTYMN